MVAGHGGAGTTAGGSPRLSTTAAATTARRRLNDVVIDSDATTVGHRHKLQGMIKHVRSRILCLPEKWVMEMEAMAIWMAGMIRWVRSGKSIGRRILGSLMALIVVTVFFKVSLMGADVIDLHRNDVSVNHRRLILRAKSGNGGENVVSEFSLGKKHLLDDQLMTPEIWMKPESNNFYKCISSPKNRTRNVRTNGYIQVHANGGLNQMRTGREEKATCR